MQEEAVVDTLIISDVHLGSELSRAKEVLAVLRRMTFRRLILLGDIFSDLNFSRLTKEHWQFLSYIRKLSNPRRNIEVVWVEGNHDQGLSNLLSHLVGVPVYQRYVWEYRGIRHIAIHGHQFDRFVVNNLLLSRLGQLLYLQLQELDFKEKIFTRYLDRLNTSWLRLSAKVASGALAYAKQGNAERIFCGHTHESLHLEKEGVNYFNTGSWVGSNCTYITIDEHEVKIHEYDWANGIGNYDSSEEREQVAASAIDLAGNPGLPTHAAYESLYC